MKTNTFFLQLGVIYVISAFFMLIGNLTGMMDISLLIPISMIVVPVFIFAMIIAFYNHRDKKYDRKYRKVMKEFDENEFKK
jgi:uncharacterized membrane protein